MGRPISSEQVAQFREFCREIATNDGSFSIMDYPLFSEENPDGSDLWEFHASNYNPETSFDIYELFSSVDDEFLIEQHGYDDFLVIPIQSSHPGKNSVNVTREELTMDKIKNLLEQAGVKPELAKQICESLCTYKATLREQFEADYSAKVQEAKKVCIEETEAHKRELARRLQIFCEAKGAAIEAQLVKQSALSESEALTKLRSVKALIEGIAIHGGSNGQSTAVVEKAKKQVHLANEERKRAIETANRQTAIAERALKENRRLTTEMAKLKETITEGRRPARSQRLDQERTQGRPVSTRATLLENQDPRPPAKSDQPSVTSAKSTYGVADIAAQVDEDLV